MIKKKLFLFLIFVLAGVYCQAQTQSYQNLMALAKEFFQQKEYEKSNECYERIIAELKDSGNESLVPTIRNSIAINNLYMGVAALKEKDYPMAKSYLEKAIKDAKPDSKTSYMIYSWMGQWNSVQSLNIRTKRGDFQQALQFSLEAERFFNMAKAPDKRLKEQLSRADILQELSRGAEAEELLKSIMKECEGIKDYSIILGKAAYKLGGLELQLEKYQLAIQYLEQGYNLCVEGTTIDAKSYAYLCADKLKKLFRVNIPDDDKAALWEKRAEELESQTAR